jgi:hypothetical protein
MSSGHGAPTPTTRTFAALIGDATITAETITPSDRNTVPLLQQRVAKRCGSPLVDWRPPLSLSKVKGLGRWNLHEPFLAAALAEWEHSTSAYHVPLIRLAQPGRSPH